MSTQRFISQINLNNICTLKFHEDEAEHTFSPNGRAIRAESLHLCEYVIQDMSCFLIAFTSCIFKKRLNALPKSGLQSHSKLRLVDSWLIKLVMYYFYPCFTQEI